MKKMKGGGLMKMMKRMGGMKGMSFPGMG